MPVSKLKNLSILILILANVALLCLLVPRFARQHRQDRAMRESLSLLCAEQNVTLDPNMIPDTATLYPLELADTESAQDAAMTALLGEDFVRAETIYLTSDGLRMGSWKNGILSMRVHDQKTVRDYRYAAKQILKDMGFSLHQMGEPVRLSPGIYALTATQSVLGVPVFSDGITLTYSNSALSRLEGTLLAGTLTRSGDTACISASEAVVAFLAARLDSGWVGGAITALSQGYYRAEMEGAAMRLTPVWKITTDIGSFLVNGLTREVVFLP